MIFLTGGRGAMNKQELFMQRCLNLASQGLGQVAPNPMVGCVITHNGKIIGEGYHKKHGQAHAEVNAINAVADKSLLPHAVLYVSLEPCAHYGKTPPCADYILQHKIPEVHIASLDSNDKVAGKGVEKLKKGGCKVSLGTLEKESRFLNRRFFTYHEKKRPYIILKWAQTSDGFIDIIRKNNKKGPNWITTEETRVIVHKWRSEEDAILIGTNTAIADDPALTVRDWHGRHPLRIVIDRKLKLPANLKIFSCESSTLIFNTLTDKKEGHLHYIKTDFNELPQNILVSLFEMGVQSLIIEGGSYLINSFISSGLWDEARVFTGATSFGEGLKAPKLNKKPKHIQYYANDLLEIYFP